MSYVSDHAVLRYIERHYGVDIEAIRAEINVPGIDTAAAFGCDTVIMGNGAQLKLRSDIVVTVLPKKRGWG
jgi:hypothetical protein